MLRFRLSEISFSLKIFILGMIFLIGKLLHSLPYIGGSQYAEDLFLNITNTRNAMLRKQNYWHTMFSWQMYKTIVNTLARDSSKTARRGERAPNPLLVDLAGCSTSLLDWQKGERPLVVAFGSYTCPVFTASLKTLDHLVVEFSDIADFIIVYIEEAHPTDGWYFKNSINISQHKSLQDRLSAARILQSHKPLPHVLVDTMLNSATISYGGFPNRLYVIRAGYAEYEGGMGPRNFHLDDVRKWLVKYTEVTQVWRCAKRQS